VVDARLAFIGVASVAVLEDATAAFGGIEPTANALADAGRAAGASLDPPDDIHATSAYRRHVAGVLGAEVLQRAADAARSAS